MSVWTLLLLLLSVPLWIFTRELERVELRAGHALTCGQGIIYCEVKSGGHTCIQDDEHVYVSSLDAYIVQCQKQQTWSLCLKVLVNVTVRDADQPVTGDGSGEEAEVMHGGAHQEDLDNMMSAAAAVRVCYTYSSQSHSSMLRFTVRSSAFDDKATLQVWMSLVVEIPEAELGSSVVVHASCTNSCTHAQTKLVDLPSIEEVCSKGLDAIFCKVPPKLHKKTDHATGAIKLYVANADEERFQEFSACHKLGWKGRCLTVEWKNASHEFELLPSSVAPCLCFEIWGNFPRTEYCPFLNETAVSGASVSVSLAETETHLKALVWSLSAPCRLEAQLWLCRKGSGLDSRCHAVNSRSQQLKGEFLQVERHPSLCVQVKVAGMDGFLGPVCPFEVKRDHWSVPLVLCALLVCLSVLAAYAVQGTLKSCVFRWLKVDDVKPAAGGVEVLLVCPPDADCTVTDSVCRLCSSLSAVGFRVSLDLWSRSEISALGPVPWLHSCLDQVQRRGGKAVLVLTQAACERAEEWGCRVARQRPEEERQTWADRGVQSLTCSEVFDASLSCILADYLLGRAGERFMLVWFDGQSPAAALPELFRGLPSFSLPSQSLDFIMELTQGPRKGQRVSERWLRGGGVESCIRGAPRARGNYRTHVCRAPSGL